MFIFLLWQENYGGTVVDTDKSHATKENVPVASVLMAFVEKKGLLLLGLVQILFEGSMHVFIMLWNPTIQNAAENDYLNVNHQSHNLKISDVKPMLPPGVTFSAFMFALMLFLAANGLLPSYVKLKLFSPTPAPRDLAFLK